MLFLAFMQGISATNNTLLPGTNVPKELAIKSAQMAHKSLEFNQKCYFFAAHEGFSQNIDTALFFLRRSISLLDSVLLFANDSNLTAINLAKSARNNSIDAYRALKSIHVSDLKQSKAFLKKAMYYTENATVDAYHSSLYLMDKVKTENKAVENVKEPEIKVTEKKITKLDIDQSLFTILKEDISQKKTENSNEIVKLTDELFNAKDPVTQTKLKKQLKELEAQKTNLETKQNQADQKLTAINTLIEKREQKITPARYQEDSLRVASFTKPIITDEWNKQIKSNTELPDGLIYQVQLGVFKSDVLAETFKGLTPIYTTNTDKGVCYSIGLFEKFNDAKEAKNNIKEMGLTDAFVVAYFKKKKITLAEAAKLEKK